MPNNYLKDTIAAISTAIGEAGISIIRISGSNTKSILCKIYGVNKPKIEPNIVHIKWLFDPVTLNKIDRTSFVFMASPRSYTGEDMAEIGCHGGVAVTRRILDIILKSGATLADRGEFTKRAFLNGKIDLIQAESVIEIIKSKTERAVNASISRLAGDLSSIIHDFIKGLRILAARIEASIDFSDDVNPVDKSELLFHMDYHINSIRNLIDGAEKGILLNRGVRVVIVGRPNAGKSSLFNAILKRDRSIVTDIPGTTTDTIDGLISIDGIPINLTDTAGLRDADNAIETEGIRRTMNEMTSADIIIVVIDAIQGIDAIDIGIINNAMNICRNVIIAINKCDIRPDVQIAETDIISKSLRLSAVTGEGIEILSDKIVKTALKGSDVIDGCIISNMRQKDSIQKAMESLLNAKRTIENDIAQDLIMIDLKEAIQHLSEMMGEAVSSEIIDKIFDEFCIGK